jgi:hypothetical protein
MTEQVQNLRPPEIAKNNLKGPYFTVSCKRWNRYLKSPDENYKTKKMTVDVNRCVKPVVVLCVDKCDSHLMATSILCFEGPVTKWNIGDLRRKKVLGSERDSL